MSEKIQKRRAIFWELHSGLPREGPGSAESTKRALELAAPIPRAANILDIASGPGAQTIELARLVPEANILAVDIHQPFVDETNRRAGALGVAHRVNAIAGDMRLLPFSPASFDLIWCEGAAYVMGIENALRAWRPLLRPGGRLALTEPVWLSPNPPDEARRNWSGYADMADVDHWRKVVQLSGYTPLGDFILPDHAWWEYYTPLQGRLRELAPKYVGNVDAENVLKQCDEEIATYRDYGSHFGYAFLVMGLSGRSLSKTDDG